MDKKLYRNTSNKLIAGVCSGLAEYINIDPTVVRVIWAVTSLCAFVGVVAYAVCAFVIPEKPDTDIVDAE